jgi:hypothetical protein
MASYNLSGRANPMHEASWMMWSEAAGVGIYVEWNGGEPHDPLSNNDLW